MAKNRRSYDDEIDLIELVQVFLTHKTKYILLGLVGLILGVAFTYQHEPRFETKFKIHVGHPVFTTQFFISSSAMQTLLNESALNEKNLPNYSFNNKTKLFTVTTSTEDASQLVSEVFTNAMQLELKKLKSVASNFEGFDNKPVILNNNKNNNLTWTNKDIAKLNIEEVIQSLVISFGKPKVLYPKPLKHGVIGIVIGLVLAFFWMMADILIRQFKKK